MNLLSRGKYTTYIWNHQAFHIKKRSILCKNHQKVWQIVSKALPLHHQEPRSHKGENGSRFKIQLFNFSNMANFTGKNKEKTYLILFGMLLSIAAPILVWMYLGKDVNSYTITIMGQYKVKIFVWAVFFLISNITNCLCPYTHQFIRSGSHLARIAFVILAFIMPEHWWYGFYAFVFLFLPGLLLLRKDDQFEASYATVVLSTIGTMISLVLLVFAYLSLFNVIY